MAESELCSSSPFLASAHHQQFCRLQARRIPSSGLPAHQAHWIYELSGSSKVQRRKQRADAEHPFVILRYSETLVWITVRAKQPNRVKIKEKMSISLFQQPKFNSPPSLQKSYILSQRDHKRSKINSVAALALPMVCHATLGKTFSLPCASLYLPLAPIHPSTLKLFLKVLKIQGTLSVERATSTFQRRTAVAKNPAGFAIWMKSLLSPRAPGKADSRGPCACSSHTRG